MANNLLTDYEIEMLEQYFKKHKMTLSHFNYVSAVCELFPRWRAEQLLVESIDDQTMLSNSYTTYVVGKLGALIEFD